MKRKIRIVAVFAVALLASVVLADDVVYYLVPNEGGYSYTAAFTNAALWTTTGSNTGTPSGAAGSALDADKTFVIIGSKTLNTITSSTMPNTDAVFTGGRLDCGEYSTGKAGRIQQYTYGDAKTSWDNWGSGEGLRLVRGYYRTMVANVTSHIYGKMEVMNYSNNIWEFQIHNTGAVLDFHSDISGAKGQKFKVTSDAANGGVFFEGSLANFNGDILTGTTSGYGKTIGFGTTTLANKLQLCENCTLTTATATDIFTVGKLECDNIAGIDVKIALDDDNNFGAGQIVITNSVTVANGPVVVKTSYAPVTNLEANATLRPLVFGRGVAFNSGDFVWTPANESQQAALSASFVEEEDGSTSLVVDSCALVTQTVSDSQYASVSAGGVYRDSSLTNAAHWSDGCLPHAGAHYLVSAGNAGVFSLRTEVDANAWSATPFAPIDYVFPGESLSLGNKAQFVACCSNVTFKLLRMFDGSKFMQAQLVRSTLNGKVSVEGASTWALCNGELFTVKAEIVGDGEIRLVTAATSSPNGQMLLDNLNTNFTGRICVSQADNIVPDFTRTNQTVNIRDGRALGGAGAAFDPKALTLERYGSLCALESTAVSEATRGTWINGVGRMKVDAGKTLAYTAPLAVYGTFCKEGAGLLALGNAQPKFGETALETTPDATAANRTFLVRDGNVKVTNAYALNGLDVVVEDPGGTILLDADTEDETLATYGIVNVLTPGAPFGVSGSATKVKVGFTCAEKPSWPSREIAICTVKASEADAVAALLEKTAVDSGCKLKIESITPVPVVLDEVSCVTLKANVSAQRGLCIIFR